MSASKIYLQTRQISIHYFTSFCRAIQPAKEIQPTFVTSKDAFSSAFFIPLIILRSVLKHPLIASRSSFVPFCGPNEGLASPLIFFLLPAAPPLWACDSLPRQTLSFSRYPAIHVHSLFSERLPRNAGQPPFPPIAPSAFWLLHLSKPRQQPASPSVLHSIEYMFASVRCDLLPFVTV
jgi:hypothetical protein